jgi:hypothetical protein
MAAAVWVICTKRVRKVTKSPRFERAGVFFVLLKILLDKSQIFIYLLPSNETATRRRPPEELQHNQSLQLAAYTDYLHG